MAEKKKKTSEAKLKWVKKYNKETYTNVTIKFRKEELEALKLYCELNGITRGIFIRKVVMDAIGYDGRSFDDKLQELFDKYK